MMIVIRDDRVAYPLICCSGSVDKGISCSINVCRYNLWWFVWLFIFNPVPEPGDWSNKIVDRRRRRFLLYYYAHKQHTSFSIGGACNH